MAFTEKYVSTTGSGTNTGLSEANAMTWAQMVTNINAGSGAGCRYNIKANATYSLSSGDDMGGVGGSTTSPIVLRGYKTTIGDGYLGRDANGALITTNMPLIHYTSNGSLRTFNMGVLEALSIFATAREDFAVSLNYRTNMIACRVENSYNNGSAGAARVQESSILFESDFLMTGGGGNSRYVIELSEQVARLDSCRIITTTANANCIKIPYACGMFGCLVKGPGTGIGLLCDNSNPALTIRNNTITGWTDGIKFTNATPEHPSWIAGNMITDNSGYGVNFTTSTMVAIIGPNRTRDNVLGDTNNAAQNWLQVGRIIPLVTTDTGGPTSDYVSPATGDYSIRAASPGIAGNIPKWSDLGAFGMKHPTGGGGGRVRLVSPMLVGLGSGGGVTVPEKAFLINEGFESPGWPMGWGGTADPASKTSPLVGAQSLRLIAGKTATILMPPGTGEIWCKWMIRGSAITAAYAEIFSMNSADFSEDQVRLDIHSDRTLNIQHGGLYGNTVAALVANTIYYIWYHYKKGTGANGISRVWFNTTDSRPADGSDNSAGANNATCTKDVGNMIWYSFPNTGTMTIDVDNVQVSTTDF